MQGYQQQWASCLQMFREEINSERVFNVWFKDIAFLNYDEQHNTVYLHVPSKYVYQFLEMYYAKLLSKVLSANFKPDVKVHCSYTKEPEFAQVIDYLKLGLDTGSNVPQLRIPNARERLEAGLKHYLGEHYQWLPCYDEIADWLTDNKGRGLLCVGTPGLGKTLVCKKILPVIIGRKIPSVTALEMNSQIDSLLKEKYAIIDDLGKEPVETKTYGNRRTPFFELCDAAEQKGNLLIITTNLSTTPDSDTRYPDSIQHRYGPAVISRLRATTKVVIFEGKDMRGT